ncbi:MAG: response regulator [Polyangiaceae bacterium]|nr:response regulator [Polyangiaceae bacterium]
MTFVLVVDDSAIDRRLAGALLTKRGFEVEYATDGRDALEQMERAMPDVVVTDLQMPNMTGLELVEIARQRFPSLPIVLMTAHGSEQIAMLALKTGAASFVPKRRLAGDLCDTIAALVTISHDAGRVSTVDPLDAREIRYVLGTDLQALGDVVGQLEAQLLQLGAVDGTSVVQVAVALREAIVNAIVHGNLEVSSSLLEDGGPSFAHTIEERQRSEPFAGRKVTVIARYAPAEVAYVIIDEGPGFDPSTLPDPTDASNLEKSSGRGLMLIRTFMDEVSFNERGNEIRMKKRLS